MSGQHCGKRSLASKQLSVVSGTQVRCRLWSEGDIKCVQKQQFDFPATLRFESRDLLTENSLVKSVFAHGVEVS